MLLDEFVIILEETMHPRKWVIFFKDDPCKRKYELGTFKMLNYPYWIEDKGGHKKYEYEFHQGADKLASDKVFDGRSLKERWDNVVFIGEAADKFN